MTVTVYILRFRNGTHYTGMTKDLQRRVSEHSRGKSRSTRHRGFFEIAWTGKFDGYKNARIIEKRIKQMGAGVFLKELKYRKNTIQF